MQIGERVVADGTQHYQQFRDLRSVLGAYDGTAGGMYVRTPAGGHRNDDRGEDSGSDGGAGLSEPTAKT